MDSSEKMYSQIIYKTQDDEDLHQILYNKARSASPKRVKRWSPEISLEERTVRKKQREDEYIKNIYPEERPILLVKNKQKFKNLGNPNLIGSIPEEENNFKVTRNTELLADMEEDIERNKPFIRRFTKVHDRRKGNESSPVNKSIYKVDGIEYLPEGFLELDPLLPQDEYDFDSDVLKQMFNKEQRKVKALRRKQYSEKNYHKKRDVTIYVIEEFKDRAIEFLDLWFEKYHRKMTKNELKEVAGRLETTLENLSRLQELYLKRKRLLRTKQMKEVGKINGTDWKKAESLAMTPMQIRDYMKREDKFNHIKSKVKQDPLGKAKWRYKPAYMNGYNKKKPVRRSLSLSYSGRNLASPKNRLGKKANKKMKLLGSGDLDYYNRDHANLGFKDDENSVSNTFYMLSKTNNDEQPMSRDVSKLDRSDRGNYDHMVDEFNDILDGKDRRRSSPRPVNRRSNNRFGNPSEYKQATVPREIMKVTNQALQEVGMFNDGNNDGLTKEYLIEAKFHPEVQQPILERRQQPETETNYNNDLKTYFDDEINIMLDKIKGYKVDGLGDGKTDLGTQHQNKNMNGSNSMQQGELEQQQALKNQVSGDFDETEKRQLADEMFHEKEISELKNRIKSQTSGDALRNSGSFDHHKRDTYQGKMMNIEEENQEQLRNLVNPEENVEGMGEIEMLKRQTISRHPSPGQSIMSLKKSFKDELISRKLNGETAIKKSATSENFTFDPQNHKENSEQVPKNRTVSMIMDEMKQRSNLKDGQSRSKANTHTNFYREEEKDRSKTIMGRELEQLKNHETLNEGGSSVFDDPNENEHQSKGFRSRHQSEDKRGLKWNSAQRQKANTMMNKLSAKDIIDRKHQNDTYESEKVESLLSGEGPTNLKKRVTFFDMEILPEENEELKEFVEKVPAGSVQLTREQRDKLIEVLETPTHNEEDIILTLNGEQVLHVVQENLGEEGVQVAIDEDQRDLLTEGGNRLSLYPKNFFAMVEKNKLKGSRMSVYPGEFLQAFDSENKGKRKSMRGIRQKAVSVYPKDLFDLVEDGLDEGRVSVYPQEVFDLLREFGEFEIDDETREKARSVYPADFLELAEKQAERRRDRNKTVYPKELFEIADQEKVNCSRVSVYPKDLFNLMEKEARDRGVSIYPGDLFSLLGEDYGHIINLTPEQTEEVVKVNSGQQNTQIVISQDQRKTLLLELKENKAKEDELMKELNIDGQDSDMAMNEEMFDCPVISLEKDQVMDIFNQNCLMDGAEIELTASQMDILETPKSVRQTVIGGSYYDALQDELVDDYGQRIPLGSMSVRQRKTVLANLPEKTFSVMLIGEEHEEPVLINEVYYDADHDGIVNLKTSEIVASGEMPDEQRNRLLTRMSVMNQSQNMLLGNTYYDAMVDEIVDKSGKRHTLKDMALRDVKQLVDMEDCERMNIVVQTGPENILILENVTYLPIEDCLIDAKGYRTSLADLKEEQRQELMTALGSRRGSLLNNRLSIQPVRLSIQGGILNMGEEEDAPKIVVIQEEEMDQLDVNDSVDRDKIRNRKKTGYPTKKKEKGLEDIEKMFNGEKSGKGRGSITFKKKNYSGKMRKKANTLHPKGKAMKRKVKIGGAENIVEVYDLKDSESKKVAGKRGKNISPKRLTFIKKKKTGGKARHTVMGKLTESEQSKLVEEEFLSNHKQNPRKSKVSSRNSVVVNNIVRKGRQSLLTKLVSGENAEVIEKRHTVTHSKTNKDSNSARNKAKTIHVKDKAGQKKSKKSILTESEGSANIEMTEIISEARVEEVMEEPELKEVEDECFLEESEPEVKQQSVHKNNDNLERFEDMQKDRGVSKGGRKTFAVKKKKKAKTRKRGHTYANKLTESKKKLRQSHEEAMPILSNSNSRHTSQDSKKKPKSIEHHGRLVSGGKYQEDSSEKLVNGSNKGSLPLEISMSPDFSSKGHFKHNSAQPSGAYLRIQDNQQQMSLDERPNKNKIRKPEERYISPGSLDDKAWKNKIKQMFAQEKDKISDNIMDRCMDYIDQKKGNKLSQDQLMEEFHKFCKEKLPNDTKYKESIMYISLFYYFLEKKKDKKKSVDS